MVGYGGAKNRVTGFFGSGFWLRFFGDDYFSTFDRL